MSKKLVPLKQGDLDGLCSVYSVFNALRYMHGDSFMSIKENYEHACKMFTKPFEENVLNLDITLHGANVSAVIDLLHYMKEKYKNFEFRKAKRKEDIFSLIDKGPVIIGFSGIDNHWTVITHYDEENFHLFDSSVYTKFKIDDVLFSPKKKDTEKVCVSYVDIVSLSLKTD